MRWKLIVMITIVLGVITWLSLQQQAAADVAASKSMHPALDAVMPDHQYDGSIDDEALGGFGFGEKIAGTWYGQIDLGGGPFLAVLNVGAGGAITEGSTVDYGLDGSMYSNGISSWERIGKRTTYNTGMIFGHNPPPPAGGTCPAGAECGAHVLTIKVNAIWKYSKDYTAAHVKQINELWVGCNLPDVACDPFTAPDFTIPAEGFVEYTLYRIPGELSDEMAARFFPDD